MKLKMIRQTLAAIAMACPVAALAADPVQPAVIVDTSKEPMVAGQFQPTWESLSQYQTPEWFRDAKFGIWAHWGPQCQPEAGDWYARNMYFQNNWQYKDHLARYGHPSEQGFKDIIHVWKAENFDPEKLLALYKRAGAQYFFALANHHDNFDNWDSKYQPWNSVNMGPQKNLIGMWEKAARANGLKFGVSVHAAHAWSWYESAQGSDKDGPYAGKPYDGKLTKADGKGTWWDGYDPQDLYAQDHKPGKKLVWDWQADQGSSTPDQAYCDKFYNRTMDLINKYHPDLVYFDDTALPLWPVTDAGLKIAANLYNESAAANNGKPQAVIFGKVLNEQQRHCIVWDIERGQSQQIEPLPWQTDTCLGNWHYDKGVFAQHRYKSTATVVRTLADVVSKNGNLLLNVPVKGDGTIDSDEQKIVEGVADWMAINRESIFGTRPWKVFGEGPQTAEKIAIKGQGFNEGKAKPATAQDFRFTAKGDDTVYALELAKPKGEVKLTSFGTASKLTDRPVAKIEQLGGGELKFTQDEQGVTFTPAVDALPNDTVVVYKITLGSAK